ncbi:AdoMet-dependent rRNA methyltransferase spb1, partial [Coemansia sp. RSA 1722]
MGYQKKSGKGRLDKYYHLAKEQGYRARSAFKLIQLNKKYNFLGSARTLIDLCAAPGGWLQVAQKYMPVKSLIIGVDLVPIKPIPNVITFAEDILTDKCRNRLRQEMKTWKADVVLHDGAPNVGSSWSHDAYSQTELVLMSLKLATEFLNKGGTFVTKVFRSKDYNSLIWVFNQLFRKVEATKPPSSRNVSAEIFVVCEDYIAPKKIDPRFLDAKYVFEDLILNKTQTSTDIFAPETKKNRRQREGYEDGDYTLYKKIDIMEFVKSRDPAGTLGGANEMTFTTEESIEVAKLPETTEDILLACKDLRILGKKDFRRLMKWRAGLRERYNLEKAEEQPKVEENGSDGSDVEGELDALASEEVKKLKKERKRQNSKRQRQLIKMQLNMVTPTDIGMEQDGGDPLFRTDRIVDKNGQKVLKEISNTDMSKIEPDVDLADEELVELGSRPHGLERVRGADKEDDSSGEDEDDNDDDMFGDEERRLAEIESQMDEMYTDYMDHKRERDAQIDIKRKRAAEEEFHGFSDSEKTKSSRGRSDESDTDSEAESEAESESDQEMYSGSDNEDDEIRSMMRDAKKAKSAKKSGPKASAARDVKLAGRAALWFDQPVFKGIGSVNLDDITDDEDSAADGRAGQSAGKRKRLAADDDDDDEDVEMASDGDGSEGDFEADSGDEEEGDPND